MIARAADLRAGKRIGALESEMSCVDVGEGDPSGFSKAI